MKHKCYLLMTPFLLASISSIGQSRLGKEVKPYVGEAGIKRKVSELQLVNAGTSSSTAPAAIMLLRSPVKPLPEQKPENASVVDLLPSLKQASVESKITQGPNLFPSGSISTQHTWSNFLSGDLLEKPLTIPAYPGGDVGPDQVIVINGINIKVFEKPDVSGAPLVTPTGYSREMAPSSFAIGLDQFFSPVLPATSRASYPNIRYDRLSKRWILAAIEVNTQLQNNLILLAISDGDRVADSSSFSFYSFKSSLFPYNQAAPYAPYLDSATLGVDKQAVLLAGNLRGYDSVTFAGYVIDKRSLIQGRLVVYPFHLGSKNHLTQAINGLEYPIAVSNDDPASKKSFFIGLDYNENLLNIASIEYDKNNVPSLANPANVPIPGHNYTRDMSSPGALAPVYPVHIDEGRIKFLQAAIHKNKLTGNSSLWTAHALSVNQSGTFIPVTGGPALFLAQARNGSRWYEVGNIYTIPELLQSGTLYDSSEASGRRAVHYFNPSIVASGQGHTLLSGTTAAYNEYLNVFASGRYYGDDPGKIRPPFKITNTTAIYAPFFVDQARNRIYVNKWGDFSQTVVDPLDDQTIWTFQQYADVDDSYGVRAVQFKAPPPATPAAIGKLSNKTDTTIVLEARAVDNSGFFDPGKDVGGPGFNRLSVKSSGNIIVSNITFISPVKISFTIKSKNQRPGHYLLIITNPDGQIAVADYSIGNTSLAGKIASLPKDIYEKIVQTYITGTRIYPNPTNGNVTLEINAAKEHLAKVVLVDLSGRQLFEKEYVFSKGGNQAVLPTQHFIKGTYLAAIYDSNNALMGIQKIIKQ